jgi:hypothetical protein
VEVSDASDDDEGDGSDDASSGSDEAASDHNSAIGAGVKLRSKVAPPPAAAAAASGSGKPPRGPPTSRHPDAMSVLSEQTYFPKNKGKASGSGSRR